MATSFDPRVARLITQEAKRQGLDPAAVLAVAAGEGGIDFAGPAGDAGTSFGPFQLHWDGAMPKKYWGNAAASRAFAESPAGVRYALSQMAQHARGLTGEAAVSAIIRKFERPADPDTSVANAVERLGSFRSFREASQAGSEAFASSPAGVAYGPNPEEFRKYAASFLMQSASATARGERQPGAFLGLAHAYRQMQAAEQQYSAASQNAASWGGSIRGAVQVPDDASPVAQQILTIAGKQVGKPYVWGGESPDEGGFDCSGLIDYAFRQAGVKLPGGRLTTWSMMKMGQSVKGQSFRPGDWIITNGGKHVVMYAGNGKVIAAPRRGEVVQYQPLSRFNGQIVDVRRIL